MKSRFPIALSFGVVLLVCSLEPVFARPSNIQEQNLSYFSSFLQGCHTGFETLLSLTGYYEDEDVKEALQTGELMINEEDEENQTEIKIVGLGLGRTGTTSVVMALEMLGYTVVHDDEQPEITDLFDAWEEDEIDIDDFHEILGLRGYNATFKTANYKWVSRQEDVKAILTVRDNPDKYVDSWLVAAPFLDIVKQRPFIWMETVDILLPSFEAEYRMETTGGDPENYLNREVLRQTYVDYVEKVTNSIPSDRLLTFNVKEGWGPLCEFLGEPIPEGIPFPHVHTRAKLEGEMYFLRLITWIWPFAIIVPMILLRMLCILMQAIVSAPERTAKRKNKLE